MNFESGSLVLLNVCLAIIMFGVALGIKVSDFISLIKKPRAAFIGIFSQFILLPALTFLLVIIIDPLPTIALGMMLVAACPGGNISNFMTHLAKGNAALSVSLTAFASVAAIFLTPFNLQLWAGLYSPTAGILQHINVDIWEMFQSIVLILGIPLIVGLALNHLKPRAAVKISKWIKPFSIIIFVAFVGIAFANNYEVFTEYIHYVVVIVLVHNGVALLSGYFIGYVFKLPRTDRRTLSIETGIQNSGLGLVLIFTFFDGLGGMALVAAWWGIWHIISGLTIATIWSNRTSTLVS